MNLTRILTWLTLALGSLFHAVTAKAIDLEIGVGSLAHDKTWFDNTRQTSLGIFNSARSGLKYGVTLSGSDQNDGGFSQQAVMAGVGYRHSFGHGLYIQPGVEAGLGRNRINVYTQSPSGLYDASEDSQTGVLSEISLRTGVRFRQFDLALQHSLVHSGNTLQIAPDYSSLFLLNKTGLNNLVYNPFAKPPYPEKIGNLNITSLQLSWGF
ncbi:MAG: hypothetical protein Q7T36_17325 [Fluviicoccus sp.]|uniref:hypothetical protein n=1 Tax=Fluviicoccus sp. TaxID=2003552 RepID=UPI002726C5EC|nr:hypothetical protein [Fluviicoccus sp.]MDO8332230.1 hypothetical protein [Fluviicoccus sp.]